MHKKSLTDFQMFSDAACVRCARSWAGVIIKDYYDGPGTMPRALKAAAHAADLPHGFIWRLKYRPGEIKLPPMQYMIKLAVAYCKPEHRSKARDPMADAVAAEFLKLAETFRGLDTNIGRAASAELLLAACDMGECSGPVGEGAGALACDGRAPG